MSWHHYNDRNEAKENVTRKLKARQKKGEKLEPLLLPSGSRSKISQTFWGQAWCRHLESFSDYENRLPRGRSYLRQGNVLDLKIAEGSVNATVAGSTLYETEISIAAMPKKEWKSLVGQCSGNVSSMLDLLAGKIGDETLRVLTDRETGLFPRPRQMRFSCTCPDWADMCKHVAAVLYGVAVRLDENPTLLFVLRGVDSTELLNSAAAASLQNLTESTHANNALEAIDLSTLFGIDLSDSPPTPEDLTPVPRKPKKTNAHAKKSAPVKKRTPAKKKLARKSNVLGKKGAPKKK